MADEPRFKLPLVSIKSAGLGIKWENEKSPFRTVGIFFGSAEIDIFFIEKILKGPLMLEVGKSFWVIWVSIKGTRYSLS